MESTPGKGSAFTISLPAVQKAMYAPPGASSPPEESTASLLPLYENEPGKKGGYRILVVEDNDDLRGYISGLFREHFETFTASDGLEGFEAAKEIQPDIILSDVMMPGMNGKELCGKVKNSPQTAHIFRICQKSAFADKPVKKILSKKRLLSSSYQDKRSCNDQYSANCSFQRQALV